MVYYGETRLATSLRDIEKGIDQTATLLDFTADRTELDAALFEFVGLKNKFDSLHAKLAANATAAGIHFGSRIRSMPSYVAAESTADPAPIRRAATLGKWLRSFAIFADAFETGELSASHLQLIRTKLDNPTTHVELLGAQQLLADVARDLCFADFKEAAEYWLVRIDPDGKEPQDQTDKAALSLSKGRGGRLLVRGETDALSGQAIQTAIDTEAQKLFHQDAENGVQRSEAQRRMAAMHNLIVRGAARPDGTFAKPLINIVMSQKVAEWLLTQLDTDEPADHVPVDWSDVDGRCELIDGTPIHPNHALATLGVATLRRYIFDAKSRLIDVSVNARSFPQWMKIALHVQSRGACDTHGCDAPHHWIAADHIQPHSRGGPTRLANGQNQCDPDNQAKTDTPNHTPWRNTPKPGPRTRRHDTRRHTNTDNDDADSDHRRQRYDGDSADISFPS